MTESASLQNKLTPDTKPENDTKAELTALKQRADTMGITYSGNIGLETLRKKIEDKLNGNSTGSDTDAETNETEAESAKGASEKKAAVKSMHQRLYDENMKLVRIRLSCMNPNKADLPGEIITIANRYLGTVRKFVPFGDATENGYHVPYCIYKHLKNSEFLNITTVKGARGGVPRIVQKMMKEFSIEVLPQLTKEELKDLATAQIAAGSFD